MIHDKSLCKECRYLKIDSYSLRMRHCNKCDNYGEKLLKADVIVIQKPVTVKLNCPHCEEEIEIEYQDFTFQFGAPCDWSYSIIDCPRCEKKIQIGDVDFD